MEYPRAAGFLMIWEAFAASFGGIEDEGRMSLIRFLACAGVLALAGCTITQNVEPVTGDKVELVCIEQNPKVLMDGFLPELAGLVQERGIRTLIHEGTPPSECETLMTYTANWRWDMAMYLQYARIDVSRDGRAIGSAEYDARSGGGNLGKFGPTREKLEPLVRQLFP